MGLQGEVGLLEEAGLGSGVGPVEEVWLKGKWAQPSLWGPPSHPEVGLTQLFHSTWSAVWMHCT